MRFMGAPAGAMSEECRLDFGKPFVVAPGKRACLGDSDRDLTDDPAGRREARQALRKHVGRLSGLHRMLHVTSRHTRLTVLDTPEDMGMQFPPCEHSVSEIESE